MADKRLLEMAHRALDKLGQCGTFVGVIDNGPLDDVRVEFMLQFAYSILTDKTIIMPVPHGKELPAKVKAIADHIIYYNPDDPESLGHGLSKLFTELGYSKQ